MKPFLTKAVLSHVENSLSCAKNCDVSLHTRKTKNESQPAVATTLPGVSRVMQQGPAHLPLPQLENRA